MAGARLFTAVVPDADTTGRIVAIQRQLIGALGERWVRWVRRENIHLTLQFLGDTPRELIAGLAQTFGDAISAAAEDGLVARLALTHPGAFPDGRRPRVLWVGAEDTGGNLAEIDRRMRSAIASMGVDFDRKPLRPHFTVGYVKKRISPDAPPAIGAALEEVGHDEGARGHAFVPARVALVESRTQPGGSIYTEIASFPLTGRGA